MTTKYYANCFEGMTVNEINQAENVMASDVKIGDEVVTVVAYSDYELTDKDWVRIEELLNEI